MHPLWAFRPAARAGPGRGRMHAVNGNMAVELTARLTRAPLELESVSYKGRRLRSKEFRSLAMDRVSVSSPVSGISLNVIEGLVTVPENAPTAHPITPITRGQLLNTDFGLGPSSAAQITIRRRQDSEPSHAEQLAPLQFAAARAEATAREAAALEAAAISRRNIQLLDIETQELARSTSAGSRSSSDSPHRQRSPRNGSPTRWTA